MEHCHDKVVSPICMNTLYKNVGGNLSFKAPINLIYRKMGHYDL